MSDHLPNPLPGAPALRAHLKALERGVHDARNRRLGTDSTPTRAAGTGYGSTTTTGSPAASQPLRAPASSYPMPKAHPAPTAASSRADGKPRAARAAKSANDFGAFFDNIAKRAAS